jgi:hypothetical protein
MRNIPSLPLLNAYHGLAVPHSNLVQPADKMTEVEKLLREINDRVFTRQPSINKFPFTNATEQEDNIMAETSPYPPSYTHSRLGPLDYYINNIHWQQQRNDGGGGEIYKTTRVVSPQSSLALTYFPLSPACPFPRTRPFAYSPSRRERIISLSSTLLG